MGCDIHLFVEVRRKGKWQPAGRLVKNEWYDQKEKASCHNLKYVREKFYDGRYYWLFGILAGVRSNAFEPIVEPRGVPDDASKEVRYQIDGWGSDGHTHSWLTLEDILEYMWSPRGKRAIKELGANGFFDDVKGSTVQRLVEIASDPKLTPDDLRIVFFFDN